jgi:aspartyl aminopeptidase
MDEFPFSIDFQYNLLKLMEIDDFFAAKCCANLKEKYFENDDLRWFFRTVSAYYEEYKKTVKEAFKGEQLDIIVGSRTKKDFLKTISKIAGCDIEEKDFSRADVYAVPKFKSMKLMGDELIVGYGHDDRSSVFSVFKALFRAKPYFTTVAFAFDREEIGSTGLTGAIGSFFEQVLDAVVHENTGEAKMRSILRNSLMISADVDIALTFRSLENSDVDNAAKCGRGFVICRINGGKGQGGGNRAPAFLMDYLMELWDKEKVVYQVSSIPTKIEMGGGGTIGRYFAERGIPTADCGAPVAGMHGKRSILHVGDLYQCVKGFTAFMERKR